MGGEYMSHHNIDLWTPYPAPAAEDFRMGLSFIERWHNNGLLLLPETSLAGCQLRAFTHESFTEPVEKFYAINGLRYVVAAFERDTGYLGGMYVEEPIFMGGTG